jgi:hypothetical protein
MEKEEMIFDLLTEVRQDVKDIRITQNNQSKYIEKNTNDLADHIEGVIQNRKRIEYLEMPWYKKSFTKANITWILATVATFLGIIGALSKYGFISFF